MNPNAIAPKPNRSMNSVTLGFGLVSIPLSVYSGTEATRLARKEFFNGDSAVSIGRAAIRKDTGEIVDNDQVVRMAQADSGQWVPLSDDEIAAATMGKGADIQCFIPLADMKYYLAENVVQVRPQQSKGKAEVATERAFALLMAAMDKRKVAALVKIAMRGPARYALLTPQANLILIYTADAVRSMLDLPAYKPTKAELDMALTLIDHVGVDTPLLRDDTAEAVQDYVNAKAKGLPAPQASAPKATSPDLLAVLEASVASAKAAR